VDIDPIVLIARQHIIKLSAQLEAQIDSDGGGPLIEVWRRLRTDAADALAALAFADLFTEKGRSEAHALQSSVRRYDDMVHVMRDVLIEGKQADFETSDEERRELYDVLMATPEGMQTAVDLGLIESPEADVA
jgi:hypothetical protein